MAFGQQWEDARGFQLQPATNMNEEWPMVSTESAPPTRFTRLAWSAVTHHVLLHRIVPKRTAGARSARERRGAHAGSGSKAWWVCGFPTYREPATGASVPSPSVPSDWRWSSAGDFSGSPRKGKFRINKPFPVKRKPKWDSNLRESAQDLQELIDSPEHHSEFLLRPLKQLETNNHDLTEWPFSGFCTGRFMLLGLYRYLLYG